MARPKSNFWDWVDKTSTCWLWTGALRSKNSPYGCWRKDGKSVLAHRTSYELVKGLIPMGFTLDHLCKNTRCVNPEHLEPVTLSENAKRSGNINKAIKAAALKQLANPYCKNGHLLSGDNLYQTTKQRHCKTCRNAAQRKAYWRTRT